MAQKWLVAVMLCLMNSFVYCGNKTKYDDELISVTTIFRHGARAPNFLYKNDPYQKIASEIWPEGFGQLTKLGKRQHYELGRWFRERYNDFVPVNYTHKFLYVMSSNVDRCLMSVSSNLAGLFPPRGYQIWNENILWQPIPIHTRPETDDALIFGGKVCPKHARLLQEFYNSTEYQKYSKEHRIFYSYLSNHTGLDISTPDYVTAIHDILKIESQYKLLLPDWTKLVFPQHTLPIAEYSFSIPAATQERARLISGPLIDHIATFMENALSNPNAQKFLMVSGHDTTLTFLLTSLKIFDNSWPEYASSVIFELRKKKDDNFMSIYSKNSTGLYPLQLPNCTFNCSLSTFQKIIEPVRVNLTQWGTECTAGESADIIIPKDPRL